jgi:hypothetical protein
MFFIILGYSLKTKINNERSLLICLFHRIGYTPLRPFDFAQGRAQETASGLNPTRKGGKRENGETRMENTE